MRSATGWGLGAGGAALGGGLGWWAERRWLDPRRRGPIRAPEVRPPDHELVVTAGDGTRLHTEVHGPESPVAGVAGGAAPTKVAGGATAPTIVLVHGWMMRIGFWRAQLADLATQWRVVAYDQRGHGQSELPATGDWSPAALGSDLRTVIDATVPAGQRCVVVGHSMGGMALLALAEADPEAARARLAGSMLISTAANELFRRSALSRNSLLLATIGRPVIPWLMGSSGPVGPASDVMFHLTRAVSQTPGGDPSLVAEVERMVLDCPATTRARCAETLATLDLSAGIPRVPGPMVVMVGEHDRLTPPRQSAVVAAARPDAELVVLPEIGHMAPLEAPEVVNARVAALAEAVLSPGEPGDAAPARATAGE